MTASGKRRARLYLFLLLIPVFIAFLMLLSVLLSFGNQGIFTLNTGTLQVESNENFHLCILKNGTLKDFELHTGVFYPFNDNKSFLISSQLSYKDGYVILYILNESGYQTEKYLKPGRINSSNMEFTIDYFQAFVLHLGQTAIPKDEDMKITLLKNDSSFRREMCYS